MENKSKFLDNLKNLSKEELIDVIDQYETKINKEIIEHYSRSSTYDVLKIAIYALDGIVKKFIKRNKIYSDWLLLREKSKDEFGEKLCYCRHTYKCSCGDPDKKTFELAVENHDIELDDPENGWRTISQYDETVNYKNIYHKQYEKHVKTVTDAFISMQMDDRCDVWCDKSSIQKEALEYLKDNMISYKDWVAKYKN